MRTDFLKRDFSAENVDKMIEVHMYLRFDSKNPRFEN